MKSLNAAKPFRVGLALAATALLAAVGSAHGEVIATVNGAAIDSAVLDFYIQSRTNRPASQATAQEREALTAELTDIFLLSTQESAARLEKNPVIQAQIELQRRGLLAQAVANDFFSSLTVTEEEIATEYANQSAMAPTEQYKARHILVETQGEAAEIITLLDGGADFIELATARSSGPSAPNGGELGWFSPDQMVKPFADAVAGLKNGEYTKQPVQTQFGWHVILREESRATEAPTLEGSRENITQHVQNQKFQAYLQNLRDTAKR